MFIVDIRSVSIPFFTAGPEGVTVEVLTIVEVEVLEL